ncbi:hypothetical protein B0F90DRAFT_1818129 [Multifurca ochricompacta]|uniref:Uncharacterized protein n=1 Tax=Multifurca ochricompacta TaxID=376703 RepID=A0AAD4M4M4_9AGAM|nr:hypothetical protein B0F90DRAFT_1818129 [Multifurca ochricompacta]
MQSPSQQFQTPRRRPARPSLHRAVLIRSVQRAVMRVEMEKEQEQEEREVEEHVIPIEEQMEVDERDEDGQEAINEEHGEEVHEDGDDEGAQPDPEPTVPKSGWRKSLEAFKSSLQTFRSPSTSPEKTEHAERGPITGQRCYDDEYDDDHSTNDENEPLDQNEELQKLDGGENPTDALGDPELEGKIAGHQRVFTPRQFTPQRPQRPLSFMTPQVHKFNDGLSLADRVRGRKSTGGVSQASMTRSWLVTDTAVSDTDQEMSGAKAESGQRRVSQSEKQAIQERRRSALVQPDMFFGGIYRAPNAVPQVWDTIKEDDEEAETSTLLEKMKEVVEGMQRRRSIQPEAIADVPISSTPEGGKEVTGQQYEIPEDNEVTAEGGTPLQTESRSVIPSSPATPHMSDLKHVFSEKRVANMPTSYAGVVKLFKAEPSSNPETPRLDGVREMFFREREREPNTPIFEGIGEMLTTPPEYDAQEFKPSDEIDSIAPEIPAPSLMPLKGKPAITGSPSKPSSGVAEKTPAIRPMNKGRATPADLGQLADDELTPDVPPARPTKYNANAPKGSITSTTFEKSPGLMQRDQDMAVAPAKSASKTRKPAAPETTELTSQPKPAASVPEPIRRSRTTTRSVGSTDNERVESSKSTRKTMRGTKGLAAPAPAAGAEPVAEPAKSIRRGAKRSQSVDVATAAATIKRRVAKSKASDAEDASRNDGLPETADRAELPEVPPMARVQRGRTEPAETEDENAGAGAAVTAAAAKARAVASSGKSAQVVGEKENTPERVHVKEEEEERQPAIVIKGVRTRKTAAAAPKAQSEPEKDGTTVKARAPRTRAASARK